MLATDKEGQVTWKAVQEAFGAAGILSESAIEMNLRLPGQYFDQETGHHYNFFRNYIPGIARYGKSDPKGLDAGVNMYLYVSANPLIKTDTLGLQEDCNCEDPPRPLPNGCGGASGPKVSDSPGGFYFGGCCNNHDTCYATCRGPSRLECDLGFYVCMLRTCRRAFERSGDYGLYFKCQAYASAYYTAVRKFGWYFFRSARKDCCK